ncbi:hypothetical protein [Cohnella abietis]|uniref:Uncharacterized protein n=1 Tax=Cohnella abietis TaxID=2507935 RepID=A0A3T1D7I7_9BACL|nr:hypothetical protein [Cohnella abietis]BBI34050.1 hypothetical protein KCTCHS21_34490 [Cohnella abietis]
MSCMGMAALITMVGRFDGELLLDGLKSHFATMAGSLLDKVSLK